jgi:hypothetical protein
MRGNIIHYRDHRGAQEKREKNSLFYALKIFFRTGAFFGAFAVPLLFLNTLPHALPGVLRDREPLGRCVREPKVRCVDILDFANLVYHESFRNLRILPKSEVSEHIRQETAILQPANRSFTLSNEPAVLCAFSGRPFKLFYGIAPALQLPRQTVRAVEVRQANQDKFNGFGA